MAFIVTRIIGMAKAPPSATPSRLPLALSLLLCLMALPWQAAQAEGKLAPTEFYLSLPMTTIEVKDETAHLHAVTYQVILVFYDEANSKVYGSQKSKLKAAIGSALRHYSYDDFQHGNAAGIIKDAGRNAAQSVDPNTPINELLVKTLLVQ